MCLRGFVQCTAVSLVRFSRVDVERNLIYKLECQRGLCSKMERRRRQNTAEERNRSFSSDTNPQQLKFMVAGLGNPGFQGTRHNLGMMLVDKIATRFAVDWQKERKCSSSTAITCQGVPGVELILIKPLVFMNENGKSVSKAAKHFDVPFSNVYIVHDDLDRKLGKYSIKEKGSAAGHNGVRSVIQSLKTDQIPRLRIGIGRPENREDVVDYVLKKLTAEERTIFSHVAGECINTLLNHIEERAQQVRTRLDVEL